MAVCYLISDFAHSRLTLLV